MSRGHVQSYKYIKISMNDESVMSKNDSNDDNSNDMKTRSSAEKKTSDYKRKVRNLKRRK